MNIFSYLKTKWEHFKDKYNKKYIPIFGIEKSAHGRIQGIDTVNLFIYNLLIDNKPRMISRYGSSELDCTINYSRKLHPLWFLRKLFPFWVTPNIIYNICNNSGFFPTKNALLSNFSDLIVKSAKEVDFLGSWLTSEKYYENVCNYKKAWIDDTHPFFSKNPWSKALEGKRIVVVHPFSDTIKKQYERRELLFDNPDILPTFASLRVVKAVQSLGGECDRFSTWFEALKYMEDEIDMEDYDIAIIGCGAYGMPLAAHCKRKGKKAVHLGGATQLLFGIAGNRWLNDFGEDYHKLCSNPYWVRPSQSERPKNAESVEGACYW